MTAPQKNVGSNSYATVKMHISSDIRYGYMGVDYERTIVCMSGSGLDYLEHEPGAS